MDFVQLVNKKQVSRTARNNYISLILWDLSICICAWYLLLAHTHVLYRGFHFCIEMNCYCTSVISKDSWVIDYYWMESTRRRGTYEKLIKAYGIRTLFNGYVTGRWWHNLRPNVHDQQKHTPPLRTLGKPSMCVICGEWSKVYALQESLHIFIIWQIVLPMGSNEFILCCGKISWRCMKSLASSPNELHFICVLQKISMHTFYANRCIAFA